MTARPRVVAAAVLLGVEAALALLGLWVHHEFTAVYGRIGDTALEGLGWGLTAGLSGIALGAVVVVALPAVVLSPRSWIRLAAVALPILMLLGMLALTPSALRQKTETQCGSAPTCASESSRSVLPLQNAGPGGRPIPSSASDAAGHQRAKNGQ